jgi:uncharacterized protein YecE (DUF72 family)
MNTRQAKRLRANTEDALPPHEEPQEEQQQPQQTEIIHPTPQQRAPERYLPTSEHCSFLFSTLCRFGTSGYIYNWTKPGSFYHNVPDNYKFEFYSSEFDTVELNATFYRWFQEPVWDKWRTRADASRPSFEYIIKSHQFYTHMKRLNIDAKFEESWRRFYACCQRLDNHLGPILFQFPESFHKEPKTLSRLDALGNLLDPNGKFVFEFRHNSWFCTETYNLLKKYNWCLAMAVVSGTKKGWCSTMMEGPNPRIEDYPLDCCTWGAYVRFHGATGKYVGAYGPEKMAEWALKFAEWQGSDDGNGPSRRVYAAFNNTDNGIPPSAIAYPRALAEALRNLGYT